ncbi:hypothetical protein EZS27_001394 [termite gut metagenome]|uniref:ORC1/DEAH AAA+ ATPase domain-containing protein n=1 Tax=termite gut metagenome TaxID=433724 RepID=A0A5J4SZ92_9ZZZZ
MDTLSKKEKDAISEALKEYIQKSSSRDEAVKNLKGVSSATVSNITTGKYEVVSPKMFRTVKKELLRTDKWKFVETNRYKAMEVTFNDAQEYRNVRWIVGGAGCGKSASARVYKEKNENVFIVLCDEDMKKGDFVRAIAESMEIKTAGLTNRGILEKCIKKLIRFGNALLIFDEGDKLGDNVFHYFINIYNRLEEECGVVFLSTDYIHHRIQTGLRYSKKGYNEIHSRIGKRFLVLKDNRLLKEKNQEDVYSICRMNGIDDEDVINGIIEKIAKEDNANRVEDVEFDLRTVKYEIHKIKRQKSVLK